jgi:hypothetical protein
MRQRFEIILDHHTSGVQLTGKVIVVEWKDVNDPLPITYNLNFVVDEGMFGIGITNEFPDTKTIPEYSEEFHQHLRDTICAMYHTINHLPSMFIWNIKEN